MPSKKVFGYKTPDTVDLFTTYTIQGFVAATSLRKALDHFGLKESTGFTIVVDLTDKQIKEEILNADTRVDKLYKALERARERYNLALRVRADLHRAVLDCGNQHE